MFIFLSTDAFNNVATKAKDTNDALADLYKESLPIRRPYRGIQIKDDTFSTISIRRPDASSILLTSSADTTGNSRPGKIGQVTEYADYILQGVNDQRQEKHQIMETFGDPYVYFFGERPRIVQFNGLLINTEDFNWRSQFWLNYDQYMRGTKLVQQNARAYISFDSITIEGYILGAQAQDIADQPYSIPFSFSLLVTDYYDWSSIGKTTFPGEDRTVDLDVLNQELEDQRATFVSTGAQVRLKNLLANPGSGILSTLRSGIRAVNEATSFVSGIVDDIHNVIGGRVVRMPIGIAGYLQSTGASSIAGGSIGGSAILSAEGLGKQYDAATGQYEGLNGSVKMRMPGAAKYAPPWISRFTKQARGYIFENVDEYPMRKKPETISAMISPAAAIDRNLKMAERQLNVDLNDTQLATWNAFAEAGGLLNDIAEGVAFAKSAFGMVMTGLSFIRDPAAAAAGLFGVSSLTTGYTSQSRIAGRSDELEKQGIKTKAQEEANRSLLEKAGRWIGESAYNTLSGVTSAKVEDPQPSSLGDVYNSNSYTQGQSQQGLSYEPVYGNKVYDETQADREALDEIFGNNDNAPQGSDISPSSLDEVYGTGASASAVRSPEEIAAALAQAQSQDVQSDEDTKGIRGINDEDASIDPVI
jgi:hypothetical protein